MTSDKALFWTVAAGMLLVGGTANAAAVSCVAPGPHTYVVDTTPSSTCWDYDDGNVPPDVINNVLPPVLNDDALSLPTGYTDLGAGAVDLNFDGTFSLNVASSDPFILFLKQANSWAAFLLGADSGTWSIDGKFSADGISHWTLYGTETTVVPIPPAALLLGSGLLGLIGIGRRRKSKVAAA